MKYFTVSILFDLSSFKKGESPLLRVEKNWACRVSKEAEFCADFKNVQKSRVWRKGKKIFYRKTEFSGTCKILQKIVFLRKKSWGLLDFYRGVSPVTHSLTFSLFYHLVMNVWLFNTGALTAVSIIL